MMSLALPYSSSAVRNPRQARRNDVSAGVRAVPPWSTPPTAPARPPFGSGLTRNAAGNGDRLLFLSVTLDDSGEK